MTKITNPGNLVMTESTWTVSAAKAKLSEVIELARSREPQTITRHGRTAAVIVAANDWERNPHRQSRGILH
jgi:prevent-host-death family protein